MGTQIVGISLMILGAKLDDIGLWRKTGRAALYVMMAMALVSGFDYFRKFLKPLLAKEREDPRAELPGLSSPSPRPRRPPCGWAGPSSANFSS